MLAWSPWIDTSIMSAREGRQRDPDSTPTHPVQRHAGGGHVQVVGRASFGRFHEVEAREEPLLHRAWELRFKTVLRDTIPGL